LRVISRAGRPCHFSKLHHYPTDVRRGIPRRAQSKDSKVPLRAFTIACHRSISKWSRCSTGVVIPDSGRNEWT